jgi:hypothetical protein
MRLILLSLLLLAFTNASTAQNFEGKLIYQLSYKSKSPSLTEKQLSAFTGTQHEYYFKGGNYKTVVAPGAMIQWQLFIHADNKLYSKYTNTETIFWNDASVNQDSVLAFQVNKAVADISGYKCDELILTCKTGVQKYYYSSKVKVDPALFAKHKYGNWYDFLSKAEALPLKYIYDMPQYTIEGVVSEVTPMQLDDQFFQLPAGVKTAKSPF